MMIRVVLAAIVLRVVVDLVVVMPTTRFVGAQSDNDGADGERDSFLCSPNSTIIPTQCNVRFNDTLVLSCPTHSNWVKVSRNASSVCESSVCTVNSDRDLTYDDSGLYFCKNTTYSQYEVQNFYVNVTVLAPPRLTNKLVSCDGDVCYAPWTPFALDPFNVTVSYAGDGPFWVEWYFNDTVFDCGNHCSNTTTNNSQTLLLSPSARPQDWNGVFLAVVHNELGNNKSSVETSFDCQSIPISPPTGVISTELSIKEGESLNYFCNMSATEFTTVVVCFTENKNQSFNPKNSTKYCVKLSSIGQFNNSNITVHRTNKPCPHPTVMVNFAKKQLTLRDSGMIYCAFALGDIYLFAKLNLTVVGTETTNVLVYALPLSGGIVIVIVLAVMILVVVWRWKRKKMTSRDEERRPLCPDSPSQHSYEQHVPVTPVTSLEPPRPVPVVVNNSRRGPETDGSSDGGNTPRPPSSFGSFSLPGSNSSAHVDIQFD